MDLEDDLQGEEGEADGVPEEPGVGEGFCFAPYPAHEDGFAVLDVVDVDLDAITGDLDAEVELGRQAGERRHVEVLGNLEGEESLHRRTSR